MPVLDPNVIVSSVVSLLIGIFGTIVTLRISTRQNKISAEQSFRDDLIEMFESQQHQIETLNKDIMELREKNAQIREKNADLVDRIAKDNVENSKQRAENVQKISTLTTENIMLKQRVTELEHDKARLANHIIVVEDELRRLRSLIEREQNG